MNQSGHEKPDFDVWGQKAPPKQQSGGRKRPQNVKVGAKSATKMIKWGQKSAPTYNKQRVQGKNPLLERHLDGDISNAYLAVAGD